MMITLNHFLFRSRLTVLRCQSVLERTAISVTDVLRLCFRTCRRVKHDEEEELAQVSLTNREKSSSWNFNFFSVLPVFCSSSSASLTSLQETEDQRWPQQDSGSAQKEHRGLQDPAHLEGGQ